MASYNFNRNYLKNGIQFPTPGLKGLSEFEKQLISSDDKMYLQFLQNQGDPEYMGNIQDRIKQIELLIRSPFVEVDDNGDIHTQYSEKGFSFLYPPNYFSGAFDFKMNVGVNNSLMNEMEKKWNNGEIDGISAGLGKAQFSQYTSTAAEFERSKDEDRLAQIIRDQQLLKIQKRYSCRMTEGTLVIWVLFGKGLFCRNPKNRINKAFDPYVAIEVNHSIQQKTKSMKKTSFPIYKESVKVPLRYPHHNPPKSIILKIFDNPKLPETNSNCIGMAQIPITECIQNSGEWKVSGEFDLIAGEGMKRLKGERNLGTIAVQGVWIEKEYVASPEELEARDSLGFKFDAHTVTAENKASENVEGSYAGKVSQFKEVDQGKIEDTVTKETLEKIEKEGNSFRGTFLTKVHFALNLKPPLEEIEEDLKFNINSFVEVTFPNGKQFKSSVVDDTPFPDYNIEFKKKGEFKRNELRPVVVRVFSKKKNLIGAVSIYPEDIFLNPPEWFPRKIPAAKEKVDNPSSRVVPQNKGNLEDMSETNSIIEGEEKRRRPPPPNINATTALASQFQPKIVDETRGEAEQRDDSAEKDGGYDLRDKDGFKTGSKIYLNLVFYKNSEVSPTPEPPFTIEEYKRNHRGRGALVLKLLGFSIPELLTEAKLDPYIKISMPGGFTNKTKTVSDSRFEYFGKILIDRVLYEKHREGEIVFKVFDCVYDNEDYDEVIAEQTISVKKIFAKPERWGYNCVYKVPMTQRFQDMVGSRLSRLSLNYSPVDIKNLSFVKMAFIVKHIPDKDDKENEKIKAELEARQKQQKQRELEEQEEEHSEDEFSSGYSRNDEDWIIESDILQDIKKKFEKLEGQHKGTVSHLIKSIDGLPKNSDQQEFKVKITLPGSQWQKSSISKTSTKKETKPKKEEKNPKVIVETNYQFITHKQKQQSSVQFKENKGNEIRVKFKKEDLPDIKIEVFMREKDNNDKDKEQSIGQAFFSMFNFLKKPNTNALSGLYNIFGKDNSKICKVNLRMSWSPEYQTQVMQPSLIGNPQLSQLYQSNFAPSKKFKEDEEQLKEPQQPHTPEQPLKPQPKKVAQAL